MVTCASSPAQILSMRRQSCHLIAGILVGVFCSFSAAVAAPSWDSRDFGFSDWQSNPFDQQSFEMGDFAEHILGGYRSHQLLRPSHSTSSGAPSDKTDATAIDTNATSAPSYQGFDISLFGNAAIVGTSRVSAAPKANGSTINAALGATVLTYFNFNDGNNAEDNSTGVAAGANADGVASTIIPSPTNGVLASSISFVAPGTTVNKLSSDTSAETLALQINGGGSGNPNEGKSFQFTLSTANYTNISLSYATRRSGVGFTTQTLAYSTDGTTFTNFGTVTPPNSTTFAASVFDLSTLTSGAVDNQTTLTFRFTLTGATGTAGTGFDQFDNFLVLGDPITPAPEPATVASGLLGAIGLCWHQRRRLAGLLHSKSS